MTTPHLRRCAAHSPHGAHRDLAALRSRALRHRARRCRGPFTLRDYARWVYDTPAILVPDGQGGWREDSRRFSEIYAERPMSRTEVEHALSMVFPDVRLKTYLEIRPADAMPVPYAVAYAALVKGIFYCEESLAHVERLFEGIAANDIEQAKNSLQERGYAGGIRQVGSRVRRRSDSRRTSWAFRQRARFSRAARETRRRANDARRSGIARRIARLGNQAQRPVALAAHFG